MTGPETNGPVSLGAFPLRRMRRLRRTPALRRMTAETRLEPSDLSEGALTIQGAHDDVAARDLCANLAKATILIGIYFDAGPSPQNAGSVTGYDAARSFSPANIRFADVVQSDVLAALNAHGWAIPNAGVVSDVSLGGPAMTAAAADYGHLLLLGPAMAGYFSTPSQMPGALIEPLFITDPFEATVAASVTGQQAIATGLAHAVQQYFAPAPAAAGPPITP